MNILPIHDLMLYLTYLSNHLIGLVTTIITIHQNSRLHQLHLRLVYLFLSFTPLNREAHHITVIKTHQLIRFHASLPPTSISSPLIKAFDEHAKEVSIHQQLFTPGSTKLHVERWSIWRIAWELCLFCMALRPLYTHEGGVDNRGSGVWNWVKGVTRLVLVVVHAG